MSHAVPPATPNQVAQPATPLDADVLMLDAQTLRDLEVFESSLEGATLFDFCNHTRSRSGGRALRERMKLPWSDPARIRSVQQSIAFILAKRGIFECLPSYIITHTVDRYLPAQQLFSSISLVDDLHAGVSFFRAEGLRVKAIAQALASGSRVIALMDEPFKGTNVKDAFDASRAIMERFAAKEGSLFMFSSHLIELHEQLGSIDQVDCRYFEAREDGGRLSFEYVLHPGVSSQRLGMRVLHEEGIFELLDAQASG